MNWLILKGDDHLPFSVLYYYKLSIIWLELLLGQNAKFKDIILGSEKLWHYIEKKDYLINQNIILKLTGN